MPGRWPRRGRGAPTRPACSSAAPAALKERLGAFAEATGARELMITTAIFDHDARKRSYELLADAFGLSPTGAGG